MSQDETRDRQTSIRDDGERQRSEEDEHELMRIERSGGGKEGGEG